MNASEMSGTVPGTWWYMCVGYYSGAHAAFPFQHLILKGAKVSP